MRPSYEVGSRPRDIRTLINRALTNEWNVPMFQGLFYRVSFFRWQTAFLLSIQQVRCRYSTVLGHETFVQDRYPGFAF